MITGLVITPTSETSTEHLPSPSPTISVTEAPATEAPTTVPTSEPTPEPTAEPTEAPTQQPVATEPPALETQAVEQPSSGDTRMVWVGETGTKYHHEDCPSLKGKGHQITMEEALAEGRGPCGICYR